MRRARGFTLMEVMIALALLGIGLTILIKSAANSIFNAEQAHMMGVATDLARGKMYDIEEVLLKDGFSDTDQSQLDFKPFDQEGWPTIYYSYKVEPVQMPDWDTLQQMAMGQAQKKMGSGAGSGSGSLYGSAFGSGVAQGAGLGSDQVGGFQNSMLGGMLNMFGGMGGGKGGVTGAQGASLIQSQYGMFQQILKASVRKVTLTLKWQVLGRDRDMKIVAFFTDGSAMDKVLNGMGSQDLDDVPGGAAGSGSGSGKGSGSSSGPGKVTTTPPGKP